MQVKLHQGRGPKGIMLLRDKEAGISNEIKALCLGTVRNSTTIPLKTITKPLFRVVPSLIRVYLKAKIIWLVDQLIQYQRILGAAYYRRTSRVSYPFSTFQLSWSREVPDQ
jgi:hypothetical protein